jgi:hypothetical protein
MIVAPSPPPLVDWTSIFVLIPATIVLFPFWVVGAVIANRAEKATGTRPKKWPLLVAKLFLGLIFYIAASDLLRVLLEYFWVDQNPAAVYAYDRFVKNLASRMVIVLLGLPILAGVWYKATEKKPDPKQEKSEVTARKYFLWLESVGLGAVALISLGVCLYHLFIWVLGVSQVDWQDLTPAVGYGLVALAFLVTKVVYLNSLKKPPTPPASAPPPAAKAN